MNDNDVVFYGVRTGDRFGHYFWLPSGRQLPNSAIPLPPALIEVWPDGRWCWPVPRTREELRRRVPGDNPEIQGRAYIHAAEGWTILSWWDRSEDQRGGCCAVFFVRGYHRWSEALRRAREAFPGAFARMEVAYPVELAGADLPDPEVDAAAACEIIVWREVERLRALPPDILAAVLRRMEGP